MKLGSYTWDFPLPRTHTGMLLGNGVMGAMVWGEGAVLRITVGRADFWDHRGGIEWTADMSYRKIGALLEAGNQKALWELFAKKPADQGQPDYPTVLPLGRIELDLGRNAALVAGSLDLDRGLVTVRARQGKRTGTIRLVLDLESPLLAVEWTGVAPKEIRRVPAWEYVKDRLAEISFTPPRLFDEPTLTGWVQERPADPPLCLAYRCRGRGLHLTTAYGEGDEGARKAATQQLDARCGRDFVGIARRAERWWRRYWKQVPSVDIPNERLAFIYRYGMYKFAGLTNPTGVAATLQGPWIEEYQMPPWSSDYHFNINVQMCYWPAYHGNCLEHLRPLFDLVSSWTPQLRHNARVFLGIDDGLMLPHAVSDDCRCIGGYWAGSLDHGCTAWVAQMMYRYYRYTIDKQFLRRQAYPFMVGAMRVYEEMLERQGDAYTLPVSVSPEYISLDRTTWGRNASFQLACIHRLAVDLIEASAVLGEPPRPVWQVILERLPKACLIGRTPDQRIAIWESMDLEISHRHHSHLAGIVPFDILHEDDPEWAEILYRSLNRWVERGPGLWSGWCVPWAAMIHTRFNQGEAAESLLESWQRVFTNEGHGTLHDAHIPGFTLFGAAYGKKAPNIHRHNREIMQVEAGMAACAAVQEMLLHTRHGVTHVFAGAPASWKNASFSGFRTEGGFLVSASRRDGAVDRVQVHSLKGGTLCLANPWSGPVRVQRPGGSVAELTGPVLEIRLPAGKRVILRPNP